MRKFLFCTFLLFQFHVAFAQSEAPKSSAEILQALHQLNTVGSVLYVAAHPDDENTRLLSYMSKDQKVRTGYLSITRGDGGQNLVGKEQGEMLGLIRTQELLAARRTDGAEQFFTRAFDFGYSKTPEETFNFWNRDSILSDMVWVIRNFKPDVMICRFPTTGEGGHGHHTASAILALQAFDEAANPQKFAWQLKYTQVWQARSIFWNTFNFGGTNTTAENQIKFDVGVFNPLLGKSYGEIAAESRSFHKSQGFGSAKQRGQALEYFKYLKGDSCKNHVLENINLTWSRMKGTDEIQQAINTCIKQFNHQHPEEILPQLIKVYRLIADFSNQDNDAKHWKKIKLKEVEQLILACSGLWMECSGDDYSVVPGGNFLLKCEVVARSKSNIKINKISFENQDTVINKNLVYNENVPIKHRYQLAENTSYSNPYWLNKAHLAGTFDIADRLLIGGAENAAALNVAVSVSINDFEMTLLKPVIYKSTDPVKGEIYRPLEILPAVTINFNETVYALTDANAKTIDVVVKANTNQVKGTIELNAVGFDLTYNKEISLAKKGDELIVPVTIKRNANAKTGTLKARVLSNGKIYNQSIRRINYDHIPAQFVLSEATTKILNIEIKKGGINIAYIPGAGDEIPACLKQIGYKITELSDQMIENDNLSVYDAIVTGVRAYNTNERLQIYHPKLMEYIKNGGNLIVQYNTNNRIGPVKAVIGPFPFTISRDRVTDENATMNLLDAAHPAFNTPNKIEAKHFEHWVQERGIYFATELDSNYQSLMSCNDPNEKALNGSLIVCKYGKGNFVYTGLAFFRQLPAGVEGAYQLFVNLMSLPKNQ
ncbi:MAG TPA: PIG-L family deacetylase [Bacteroidia bacterium]|nr:PIG-L family deacetylase [Bacteroidia bacterium]